LICSLVQVDIVRSQPRRVRKSDTPPRQRIKRQRKDRVNSWEVLHRCWRESLLRAAMDNPKPSGKGRAQNPRTHNGPPSPVPSRLPNPRAEFSRGGRGAEGEKKPLDTFHIANVLLAHGTKQRQPRMRLMPWRKPRRREILNYLCAAGAAGWGRLWTRWAGATPRSKHLRVLLRGGPCRRYAATAGGCCIRTNAEAIGRFTSGRKRSSATGVIQLNRVKGTCRTQKQCVKRSETAEVQFKRKNDLDSQQVVEDLTLSIRGGDPRARDAGCIRSPRCSSSSGRRMTRPDGKPMPMKLEPWPGAGGTAIWATTMATSGRLCKPSSGRNCSNSPAVVQSYPVFRMSSIV